MWIDLDLLYSIRETSYQYFGCFIYFKGVNLSHIVWHIAHRLSDVLFHTDFNYVLEIK